MVDETKRKIVIDGMLSGTGIRDLDQGGYLSPEDLDLGDDFTSDLATWLRAYENLHYFNLQDATEVGELDRQGLELTRRLRVLLPAFRVGYYSNAGLKYLTYGK